MNSFEESSGSTSVEDSIPASANLKRKAFSATLFLAAIGAYMGSFTMGNVIGFSSPALPLMKTYNKPLRLSTNEGDWFASLTDLGALVAGPVTGLMIDHLGRKSTLVWVTVPFVLGYLMIAYSSHLSMLLIGRFLTGFGCGIIALAAPIYVAEISPPSIRGRMNTIVQLSITLGIIYSFTMGYFLFWTWLAIACVIWPIFMLIVIVFMHETPLWLIEHGLPQPALRALVFLRNADWDVAGEFQELGHSVRKQNSIGRFSIKMLKEPTTYKPLVLSLVILGFQQLCGINAVLFFTVSIFKEAGSTIDSGICTIIVGVMQFVGTLIASFIIDKIGRRILLFSSGGGMGISLMVFGFHCYVNANGNHLGHSHGWIPLASLIVYNIFFAIGFGPIPWILIGELFPLRVKGFASGLSSVFNCLSSFIITREFSTMLVTLHPYGTYFFFASCCFAICIFVFIFLPETTGHTFDEIEQKFASRSLCLGLRKYKRRKTCSVVVGAS